MERGITSLGVGMAESADDSALSRFGVAKLRIKSSKRDAATVVGCGVEIHVTRRRFQAGAGIEFDVPKWNIVDVIGGHVASGTEEVQQRTGTGERVLVRAQIECGTALTFVREGVMHGFGCAVGRFRSIAFTVR